MINLKFAYERETAGAVRYQEVDDAGKVIEQAWATVGLLYLRTSSLKRGEPYPRELAVMIEPIGAVEPMVA